MNLPNLVTALTAEREGNVVRLQWTTPEKTTEGLPIKGPVVAEVCRNMLPAVTEICPPVLRVGVAPGITEVTDTLPSSLATGAAVALEYKVQLRNRHEATAGWSVPVYAAGGTAPPEVAGLRVEATAEGALLRWKPADAADRVVVHRLLVNGRHPATDGRKQTTPRDERLQTAPGAGVDARPFAADAGGMQDRTAVSGETYTYRAERVRSVTVQGRALELRSASSAEVTVLLKDTFAPVAPMGLESVSGLVGGVASVDLSWTPNTEADLAGYLVYRQDEGAAEAEKQVNAGLLHAPGYRDTAVKAGHTYRYRVVAVDTANNQSKSSSPVTERVREP